jgi:hypothetical protein
MGLRGVEVASVIAAIAVAAAASEPMVSAATAAQQTSMVERRVSCATSLRALQISAFARNPIAEAASAVITTGDPNLATTIFAVDTRYQHYKLGGTCRASRKRVALTHRGLTSAGVVRAGDNQSATQFCAATTRVLLHFKLAFNSSGKPASAVIAFRTQPKAGKKSKPIGYVEWTPKKSVTYYSSRACTS